MGTGSEFIRRTICNHEACGAGDYTLQPDKGNFFDSSLQPTLLGTQSGWWWRVWNEEQFVINIVKKLNHNLQMDDTSLDTRQSGKDEPLNSSPMKFKDFHLKQGRPQIPKITYGRRLKSEICCNQMGSDFVVLFNPSYFTALSPSIDRVVFTSGGHSDHLSYMV